MAQTDEELKQEQIKFFNIVRDALLRLNPNIFNATQGMTVDAVNTEIAKAISLLKGQGLPEDSDTLKELADKIVANSGGITEAGVNTLIADYATAHPSTNVTDEHITEVAKAYHDAHAQEGGSGGVVVNPRAITIKDGITEARVQELVAQHIATIPNSLKENSIVYKWNETRPAMLGTNVSLNQEKDAGGSNSYGMSYASKKDWLFVMDNNSHTMRILKGSDLSEVMSIDTNTFGTDARPYYVTTTPDAKRVAISQLEHGFIRILKLKDDLSGYELESSIDTGGENSVGDLALDGIGATLAFTTYTSQAIKIYDLNEQGSWNHNKTYSIGLACRGVEISKDDLEIYATTTDGNIRSITKVDGVWGDVVNVAVLPEGYSTNSGKFLSLSLDKQVLYVTDAGYDNKKGRVNVFYKQEDNTWQHKYNIYPANPVADNYFGIGVALNDDNFVAFISEYASHKVYKYNITVPMVNLDANSLDPFEDGSLKHFYKLDGNVVDSVGGANGTWNGTESYADAKFGQGAIIHNEDDTRNVTVPELLFTKDKFTYSFYLVGIEDDGTYAYVNHNGEFYVSPYFSNKPDDENIMEIRIGDGYSLVQLANPINPMDTIGVSVMWDKDMNDGYPYLYVKNLTKGTIEHIDTKICVVKNDKRDGHKNSPLNSGITTILGRNNTFDNRRKIIVDHLQIFDRALTQEEITKLFEATVNGVAEPVVGYTYSGGANESLIITPPEGITSVKIMWLVQQDGEEPRETGEISYDVTPLVSNTIVAPDGDTADYVSIITMDGYVPIEIYDKTYDTTNYTEEEKHLHEVSFKTSNPQPFMKILYTDDFTTDRGYDLSNGASLASGYIDVVDGKATIVGMTIPEMSKGAKYRVTVSYTDITITEVGDEYPFLIGFLFTNDEVDNINIFTGTRDVSNYEGKTVSIDFTARENHTHFGFKCRDTAKLETHITSLKIEEI